MLTLGSKVKYIKTHEGHFGKVSALVHNAKGTLVKVGMQCGCGSNLWLNPKDLEVVKP